METNPPPIHDEDAGADHWEALARYLAGESPAQEVEDLERWLAEDPRRKALLGALDQHLHHLRAAPPAGLDVEAALASVRGRLNEREVIPLPVGRAQEPSRSGASRILLRVAAAAVLALGTVAVWQAVRGPQLEVTTVAYSTGVGQTNEVTLSDGTRVQLAPDSRLSLAPGYGGESREVVLNGEARFEVVHDEARPFRVRAGAARIEDLGTVFGVRAVGDGEVRVVVTEGSVRFASAQAPDAGLVLRAGDRGRLPGEGAPVAEPAAATDADLAWTTGQLVFQDAPLSRVVADLRRWYGVELRLADSTLAGRHVTTTVVAGEPVSDVLEVIRIAFGGRVLMRGDTAVLSAPEAPAPR